MELKVGKVEFLSKVKDNAVRNITISIAADKLDEDDVTTLCEYIQQNKGNAFLSICLADGGGQNSVRVKMPDSRISVNRQLLDYMDSREYMSYIING